MMSKKIRSIIIEDEMYDRKLIEKILTTNYSDYIDVVDTADSIENAVTSIQKNQPDLLFLDIELNGDRLGAYKLLEQVGHNFKIVFVTAKSSQDDLLRAIKLSCIDYLVKPTRISDFESPIKKVFEEVNENPATYNHKIDLFKHNISVQNLQEAKISLQVGFTFLPTAVKNIVRCEAEGNYTKFILRDNTKHNKSLVNGNLKSFEDRLTGSGFCRVSKSDLINLSHISSFSRGNNNWELVMSDGKTIYISVLRRQSFLMEYNSFHLN